MYWKYFKYIIQHKWFVFIECLKLMQPWHGVVHDLSKFLPSEFFPYAHKFFSGDYAYKYFEVEDAFSKAWLLHQHRNKHHWDYWVKSDGSPVPMPGKYVVQMIADWRAMSRKFGGTAVEYYVKGKQGMVLHSETVDLVECMLKIRDGGLI